ncbi:MAG: DUF4363 family protein [Clostridia bacterium]|nr:DUF4363 family protein [Clostridia bacterium]
MKSFIGAMVIFAFIFAGTGYYSKVLSAEINHLEQRLSEVTDCLQHDDWEGCKEKTDALMHDWNKAQKWLKSIVNHKEIDLILQTLYEMKGYVDVENKDEALIKAGVLKMFFQHIPENEALSIMNIL